MAFKFVATVDNPPDFMKGDTFDALPEGYPQNTFVQRPLTPDEEPPPGNGARHGKGSGVDAPDKETKPSPSPRS